MPRLFCSFLVESRQFCGRRAGVGNSELVIGITVGVTRDWDAAIFHCSMIAQANPHQLTYPAELMW